MVPDRPVPSRNQLLPLSIVNGRITVAMANPENFAAIRRRVRQHRHAGHLYGGHAIPQVKDAINRYLRANAELTELSHEIAATAAKEVDLRIRAARTPPVARFVSLLINRRPSDDHCS